MVHDSPMVAICNPSIQFENCSYRFHIAIFKHIISYLLVYDHP